MSDLIRRDDAREAIEKLMEIHFDRQVVLAKARDAIVSLPSAEAVQGEWIPLVMNGEYKCSVCGRASKSDNAAWVNIPSAYWNFCPNCGADMRGGDSE